MAKKYRHIIMLTLFAFATMSTNASALADAFTAPEPVAAVQTDCHGNPVPVEEEQKDPCNPDGLPQCQICAIMAGLFLADPIASHERFSSSPLNSLTGLPAEAEPDPPRTILL